LETRITSKRHVGVSCAEPPDHVETALPSEVAFDQGDVRSGEFRGAPYLLVAFVATATTSMPSALQQKPLRKPKE